MRVKRSTTQVAAAVVVAALDDEDGVGGAFNGSGSV